MYFQFRFPWLLTALHTGCVTVGCTLLLLRGHFKLSSLTMSENLILVAFSFLFTINIAISNVSLYVLQSLVGMCFRRADSLHKER